jgi:hypothetical protein
VQQAHLQGLLQHGDALADVGVRHPSSRAVAAKLRLRTTAQKEGEVFQQGPGDDYSRFVF